eukprot:CAMPEP_0196721316 /NCGR_PEP_ID=MMETSP1091-20130531/3918_1 /TAXON_ID=302021 /ORGANISM="Rhodomonas sp., Strain CCMP768" /LENGTH=249 /DNA_ID=CAMNT_0042062761 /DNA_START=72 /DNA_END=821 /DNA_ORIENTATION=-
MAEPKVKSDDCDTCRTIVEQFYKGWEKVISGLAADGTFESRPGGAPKITYNQDIEDYLQGFCDSEYMKGYAPYVDEGCRRIMKQHHRPIVGKFLHGEERYGSALVRTERPQRILSVCTELVAACPAMPPPAQAVTAKTDRCAACQRTVADAQFVVRRSRFGQLRGAALAKRKLDLLDLFEPLCLDAYTRHDDYPETINSVCSDMWEQDEDAFMDGIIQHWGDDAGAVREICVESFSVCKPADLPAKAEL